MPDNQNIRFVSFISYKDYASDRRQMVPPAELTDEFYTLRHILPSRVRSPRHYAIDGLVSIEYVGEKDSDYLVRYQLADTDEVIASTRQPYERTSLIEPDGALFARFAQKSLFRKIRERRAELGYFLSLDEDWEELLLDVSQKQPRGIS